MTTAEMDALRRLLREMETTLEYVVGPGRELRQAALTQAQYGMDVSHRDEARIRTEIAALRSALGAHAE